MLSNQQGLRKALEFADRELRMATEDDRYGTDLMYLVGCMRTVAAACRAAPAAPPRNCDVGTADDQFEMWQAFCNQYDKDCTGCPCRSPHTTAYCFAKWGQMPYKEGGAK